MKKSGAKMIDKLFIDDERFPPQTPEWDCVIVRNYDEACEYMETFGCPMFISFDHDLGEGKNGYDIAKWIIDRDLDMQGNFIPYEFKYDVHSQNVCGKINIERMLDNYISYKSQSSH